jgi:carboxylesterase type B
VGYVIDFDDNYTVRSVHSSTTAAASFTTLQDCSTTALHAWLTSVTTTALIGTIHTHTHSLALLQCIQGSGAGAEDCLFVNVAAPANAMPGAKLPVLFWIHGGGGWRCVHQPVE